MVLIIVFIIVIIAGFNIVLQWQVRVKTEALRTTIEAKEKIEGELRVASAIQMDLLPRIFPPFPDKLEFDIAGATGVGVTAVWYNAREEVADKMKPDIEVKDWWEFIRIVEQTR